MSVRSQLRKSYPIRRACLTTPLWPPAGPTCAETRPRQQAPRGPPAALAASPGAAYAAGIAVGFWEGEQDVVDNWSQGQRWEPQMEHDERERLLRQWKKAVTKTLDWVDEDVD